jgi:hypothetical protein
MRPLVIKKTSRLCKILIINVGYTGVEPVTLTLSKIEFDGKKHRTNSYNEVLDVIFKDTNQLREKKRKSLIKNQNLPR